MAWFDDEKNKNQQVQQGQQPGLSSGEGAFSGSGGVSSSGQSNASGGVPQWTNIQEYMGANKSAISDQLKSEIGNPLEQEEQKFKSNNTEDARKYIDTANSTLGDVNWNRGAYANKISNNQSSNWGDIYNQQDSKIMQNLGMKPASYNQYQAPSSLSKYGDILGSSNGVNNFIGDRYKNLNSGQLALQKQIEAGDKDAPELAKSYSSRIKALQQAASNQPSQSQFEQAQQNQKNAQEAYNKLNSDISGYSKDINAKSYGQGFYGNAGNEQSLNDLSQIYSAPNSGNMLANNQYNEIQKAFEDYRKKYGF